MSKQQIAALESRLQAATNPRERVDLLNELAWHYAPLDPAHSRELLAQVRSLLDADSYVAGEYGYKTISAYHHYIEDDYIAALALAIESAAFFREQGMDRWLCWALNVQAVMLRLMGDFARAIDSGQEYYRVAKATGELSEISIALNNLALAISNSGDRESALRYLTEAGEIAAQAGDYYAYPVTLVNQASMLTHLERYDEAIALCHQALALMEEHGYPQRRITAFGQLGSTYQAMGDYATAEKWLRTKIDALGEDAKLSIRTTARYNLAVLFIEMERMDEALPIMLEAVDFYRQAGSKLGESASHEKLATIYAHQGAYKEAFHHHQQFAALRQQVFNEQSDKRVKNLQILFDVERRQQQLEKERQQYAQARQQHEQLLRMKDELVGSTAHDLKSPLTAMLLLLDLLAQQHKRGDYEGIPRTVQRLRDSVFYMRDMVVGMLDIAQLETGQSQQRETFTLFSIIHQVQANISEALTRKGLRLEITGADDAPYLHADRMQIQRVFDNLISNAIKFTPAGGRIGIHIRSDGTTCTVAITDTGIGIAPRAVPHVFERFYRTESAKSSEVEGTGLGLAIVKTIIEQHGGSIEVQSEPGTGTTFTFTIPAVVAPA